MIPSLPIRKPALLIQSEDTEQTAEVAFVNSQPQHRSLRPGTWDGFGKQGVGTIRVAVIALFVFLLLLLLQLLLLIFLLLLLLLRRLQPLLPLLLTTIPPGG